MASIHRTVLCCGALSLALAPLVAAPGAEPSPQFPRSVPRIAVPVLRPLEPARFRTPDGLSGWKVQLPNGTALPTPAIGGGRVLVGGGFGSTELYALDEDSGRRVWQAHTNDNGPTSAVTDEDTVIYNTESCTLESVDLRTGRRRWNRWIGSTVTSQPAASREAIFTCAPAPSGGFLLFCVDKRGGRVRWKQPLPADALSAPVVQGGSVYLATADGTLRTFDARTGRSRWKRACNATSAPYIADGELHTALGETLVGGVAVPVGKSPADVLPRIWRAPGDDGESLPDEHYESLARFDLTGRLLRKGISRRGARYLSVRANAAGAGGTPELAPSLRSAPADGVFGPALWNAGVDGMESLWNFQGSRPVVRDGDSICARGELLECLDARTDAPRWRLEVPEDHAAARTLTPPAVAGPWIFFGTSRGEAACVSRRGGRVRWAYQLGSPLATQPVVDRGRVCFGTRDGCVVCLQTGLADADGWRMWGGSAGRNGLGG